LATTMRFAYSLLPVITRSPPRRTPSPYTTLFRSPCPSRRRRRRPNPASSRRRAGRLRRTGRRGAAGSGGPKVESSGALRDQGIGIGVGPPSCDARWRCVVPVSPCVSCSGQRARGCGAAAEGPDTVPGMESVLRNPLAERLAGARSVLVAGAGGGFDVYAGLPVALGLAREGRRVHLANLSFSDLGGAPHPLGPDIAEVGPDTPGHPEYFPERTLARWLDGRGLPPVVHALHRTGGRPLGEAYRTLVDRLGIDAVVLADG